MVTVSKLQYHSINDLVDTLVSVVKQCVNFIEGANHIFLAPFVNFCKSDSR